MTLPMHVRGPNLFAPKTLVHAVKQIICQNLIFNQFFLFLFKKRILKSNFQCPFAGENRKQKYIDKEVNGFYLFNFWFH